MVKFTFIAINILRVWPLYICYKRSRNRKIIEEDLIKWLSIVRNSQKVSLFSFTDIIVFHKAYRNLYYARIKSQYTFVSQILSVIVSPVPLLDVSTKGIDGGLYIQHGYGTIIAPRSIGKNCWINQGVTIGYTNATDCPTIGNNVTIAAGAKVLGNVHIGNNVIIGANAVVVKDVPDNCTVVGVPAYIIKRDGIKTYEKL